MSVMGDVLPYRPVKARDETTAWLGMVIFLGSWAMLFAALFFAYGFVRTHVATWPPGDLPPLPVAWPAVNTVLLAASSAALQLGVGAIRRGAVRWLGPAVSAASLLGAGFLVSQGFLWRALYAAGLKPSTGGPYASVFYGLTWLHAVHVLVGLGGLVWVSAKAFGGAYVPARFLPVRLWTMYWHFVGIIWGLMFVSVFVI
jgi:cytochrome c oxidase subunit 3